MAAMSSAHSLLQRLSEYRSRGRSSRTTAREQILDGFPAGCSGSLSRELVAGTEAAPVDSGIAPGWRVLPCLCLELRRVVVQLVLTCSRRRPTIAPRRRELLDDLLDPLYDQRPMGLDLGPHVLRHRYHGEP
eukprot:scaffold63121_cov69-Phaeocystis_antarctica.AAC.5